MEGNQGRSDPSAGGIASVTTSFNSLDSTSTSTVPEDQLGYNPQINCGYDPQLRDDRQENKDKLRRRFEHIYEKYGRDFDGIGDEIDLATGDIVVDNGHLQCMQHEADVGLHKSSKSQEEAGEEVNRNKRSSEDSHPQTSGLDYDTCSDSDAESDGAESSFEDAGDKIFSSRDSTADSATSLFEPEESSGEEDLRFRRNKDGGNASGTEITDPNVSFEAQGRRASNAGSETASTPEPELSGDTNLDNILDRLPALKESMLTLQSRYEAGQSMDQDAIQALGMSIANQLASFVSSGRQPKSKRKPDKTNSAASSFLDSPLEPPAKRQRRSLSPLPSIAGHSPNEKSIWAPGGHPRPSAPRQKKGRRAAQADGKDQPLGESEPCPQTADNVPSDFEDARNTPQPSERIRSDKNRKCTHCNSSDSYIWRKGPQGLLCNTCGMYFYRYGLMRPLEILERDEAQSPANVDDEMDPLLRDWLDWQESDKKEVMRPTGVQNSHFTLEEDAALIRLKEIESFTWERMATYFPGRSAYALQCRYSKKLLRAAQKARELLLSQGYKGTPDAYGVTTFSYKRGRFTEEEDDLLLKLRDTDGLEWAEVAVFLEGRSPEALEQRYFEIAMEYLGGERMPSSRSASSRSRSVSPHSRSGSQSPRGLRYSFEEDSKIVRLREINKLSWAQIADALPGRNSFSLQKRYAKGLCGRHPNSIFPSRKAYDHYFEHMSRARAQSAPPAGNIQPHFSSGEGHTLPEPAIAPDVKRIARVLDNGDLASLRSISGREYGLPLQSRLHRTAFGSMERPRHLGPFSEAEDKLIIQLREIENLPWPNIAEQLPGRSVPALSERYYHHLLPQKARALEAAVQGSTIPPDSDLFAAVWPAQKPDQGSASNRWATQETDLVVLLHKQGKSWAEIAERLPGRTARAAEGHYAMVCGRTKRPSLQSATSSKLQAPLLKQAVNNSRRQSMSAARPNVINGSQGSQTPGNTAAVTLPRYRLLLPSPMPLNAGQNESSSATIPLPPKPVSKRTKDRKLAKPMPPRHELDGHAGIGHLEAEAPSPARHESNDLPNEHDPEAVEPIAPTFNALGSLEIPDSPVEITESIDKGNYINPQTPSPQEPNYPCPMDTTPLAITSYATPARYNPQSHPYFVNPMELPQYPMPEDPNIPIEFPGHLMPQDISFPTKPHDSEAADRVRTAQAKPSTKQRKRRTAAERPTQERATRKRKSTTQRRKKGAEEPYTDDEALFQEAFDNDGNDVMEDRPTNLEDSGLDSANDMEGPDQNASIALDIHGMEVVPFSPEDSEDYIPKDGNHADDQSAQKVAHGAPEEESQDESEVEVEQPPYTMNELAAMALESKAPDSMTMKEIFRYLESQFEWCRRTTLWRNRLRRAMQIGIQFAQSDQTAKGKYYKGGWVLASVPAKEIATTTASKTKAQRGLRRAKVEKPSAKGSRRPRGRPRKVRDEAVEDAESPSADSPQPSNDSTPPPEYAEEAAADIPSQAGRTASSKRTKRARKTRSSSSAAASRIGDIHAEKGKDREGDKTFQEEVSEQLRLEAAQTAPPNVAGLLEIADSEAETDRNSQSQESLTTIESSSAPDRGTRSSPRSLSKQRVTSAGSGRASMPRQGSSSILKRMHQRRSDTTSTSVKETSTRQSRTSSVATEGRRRVVYTALRNTEGSEDELA